MRFLNPVTVTALFLALRAGGAGGVFMSPQTISLPRGADPRFMDVEGNGRLDLVALDPAGHRLLIFRQRDFGFTNALDQAIDYPATTAWIGFCDVDAQPGLELVCSTADGLFYHRRNGAGFETEWRTLIASPQVFAGGGSPSLLSLATNRTLPVITASEARVYQRNDAFEWIPQPPLALSATQTRWDTWPGDWTVGASSPHRLHVQQFFRPGPAADKEREPESDALRKLMDDLKKASDFRPPVQVRADLDGDGREDLLVWLSVGQIDFRTDLYVFLRGPDGRLPDRPTQVLHCRGLPIPIGSPWNPTPVGDLAGDGRRELVLLELKSSFTSVGSLLDMALSDGLDWSLTVRTFHRDGFSRNAETASNLRLMLDASQNWSLFVCGDFNGDGRPDLVMRRSVSRWEIYPSVTDGRWFAPQEMLSFESSEPGHPEIRDLNGDGRSDIALHPWNSSRIFIWLTPKTKGGRP